LAAKPPEFIGYGYNEADIHITKYRKVRTKEKDLYQLVFNITPFYAEGGGQVGDTGYIESEGKKYAIIDVKKEHNQIIHFTKELPNEPGFAFKAYVNREKRLATECNHSATHLLHHALRKILGTHVEQKGSLVAPDMLRFDFSHFQKVTDVEIAEVERLVNQQIRANMPLEEKRETPVDKAREMGAMALFGEKYGDLVRVIKFGDSVELCGGTHIKATGQIGFFKITSESSIAAGIRRIEAITAYEAEKFINTRLNALKSVSELLKSNKNLFEDVEKILVENQQLSKQVEQFSKEATKIVKSALKESVKPINGVNTIIEKINVGSANDLKDIAYQLKGELDSLFLIIGAEIDGKANLVVMVSDDLIKSKGLNAGTIIREISKEVDGGGGGQPFLATAGGKNPVGIQNALDKGKEFLR
jgi:alanyl-tRNA synthetase